jgi:hypothetical protein
VLGAAAWRPAASVITAEAAITEVTARLDRGDIGAPE